MQNPAVPTSPQNSQTHPAPAHKLWTAGSLTYTTPALLLLFFWLLWGDFAWSMRDRSVPNIIQLLFTQYHASDTLSSLLMGSLPAVLSMIIGPIVSYKSDRYRSRWGRRIPFLFIPTPIIVLSIIALAYCPQGGAFLDRALGTLSPGLNSSTLIFIGLFWVLFEFACITANSVFGGLVNDVVPQSVVGRFFGMFRVMSLLAGILFNFYLFGHADTYYRWIFLGIAVLYGAGFTLMCLKVKEGEYPPPPAAPEKSARGFIPAATTYFRECFGHRYYVTCFIAGALASITFNPVNLFSIFYAKSLGMNLTAFGKCFTLTYIISLILAYPLGVLCDRFHPLRMCILALALYSVSCLWGGLYAHTADTFAIALVAHGVLSGIYFTVSASLGQRLLPNTRFAELASAGGIVGSVSSTVVAPIMGQILDHSHHAYYLTFYAGLILSVVALAANLLLYRKFTQYGGPDNYVAPNP
jgi:MFS family permease